jgi:hypothetical protein
MFAGLSLGNEKPAVVLEWPASGHPVVRFSFGRFQETGYSGQHRNYTVDVTAENLWGKKITDASFSLYLFDKEKARIGHAWINISDVAPGETVKFQIFVESDGSPVSMELAPRSLPPELQPARTISITVNSVPQGAALKVDGVDSGVTPKVIRVTPGKHTLEFSKIGFNTGHYPLEMAPDEAPGGSVTFELGTAAWDTIELRDGTVINGDLESVSATEVSIKVGGVIQQIDRNKVKRISLVTREPLSQ